MKLPSKNELILLRECRAADGFRLRDSTLTRGSHSATRRRLINKGYLSCEMLVTPLGMSVLSVFDDLQEL